MAMPKTMASQESVRPRRVCFRTHVRRFVGCGVNDSPLLVCGRDMSERSLPQVRQCRTQEVLVAGDADPLIE
jgi:hypothetical protein